jgi:uncharacterized protein YjgD (DUF1641 family)
VARPIPLSLVKRDPSEELLLRLERAPAEHAEAVLAGFEVLQSLHAQGVLELARGVLGGGNKILEIVVEAGKTPEGVRALRNLLILGKILGSIQPELLEKFARAVPDALESVAKGEQAEPPGIWGILKIFRSANLRRGLAVVNNLLEAWGRNFSAVEKP